MLHADQTLKDCASISLISNPFLRKKKKRRKKERKKKNAGRKCTGLLKKDVLRSITVSYINHFGVQSFNLHHPLILYNLLFAACTFGLLIDRVFKCAWDVFHKYNLKTEKVILLYSRSHYPCTWSTTAFETVILLPLLLLLIIMITIMLRKYSRRGFFCVSEENKLSTRFSFQNEL